MVCMRSWLSLTLDLFTENIVAESAPVSKIETIKITMESSIKLKAFKFLGMKKMYSCNSDEPYNQAA